MVFMTGDSLEPPRPPSLWRTGACASLSWKVGDNWHLIAGDCVEKPEHMSAGELEYRAHLDYGLNLILNGKGFYRDWNNVRHPIGPGVVYQRVPGRLHSVAIDPDCHWCEVYVSIRARTVAHLKDLGLIHDCPVYYVKHPELISNQFRDILQALAQVNTGHVPSLLVSIQNLLISIHEDAQSEADPDPYRAHIADACTILDCNLDQNIDIESVAVELGLAYETFRKAFKERKGIAPGSYRMRKRIERSCVLLQSTQLPVNVIAEQLGYSDGFSFSAQFKKIIGMAPSAYRLVKN